MQMNLTRYHGAFPGTGVDLTDKQGIQPDSLTPRFILEYYVNEKDDMKMTAGELPNQLNALLREATQTGGGKARLPF